MPAIVQTLTNLRVEPRVVKSFAGLQATKREIGDAVVICAKEAAERLGALKVRRVLEVVERDGVACAEWGVLSEWTVGG